MVLEAFDCMRHFFDSVVFVSKDTLSGRAMLEQIVFTASGERDIRSGASWFVHGPSVECGRHFESTLNLN